MTEDILLTSQGLLLLFKLLIAHAICDFALQTPAMARGKNRHNPPEDNCIPKGQKPATIWPYWLTAHALIHAGGVWAVTGVPLLGALEAVLHWVIDYTKCENLTTVHYDQFCHFLAKAFYVVLYFALLKGLT